MRLKLSDLVVLRHTADSNLPELVKVADIYRERRTDVDKSKQYGDFKVDLKREQWVWKSLEYDIGDGPIQYGCSEKGDIIRVGNRRSIEHLNRMMRTVIKASRLKR